MSEGRSFLENLVDAAKENPLAAALIGTGVFWLISGVSSPGIIPTARKAATGAAAAGEAGLESGRSLMDGVSAGVREVTSHASAATEALTHLAPNPVKVAEIRDRAASGLADVFERQPLAVGLLGILAGALVAGAAPSSEREVELMGAASSRAKADLRGRMEAVKPVLESGARDLAREAAMAATELAGSAKKAGVNAFEAGRESLVNRTQGD